MVTEEINLFEAGQVQFATIASYSNHRLLKSAELLMEIRMKGVTVNNSLEKLRVFVASANQ